MNDHVNSVPYGFYLLEEGSEWHANMMRPEWLAEWMPNENHVMAPRELRNVDWMAAMEAEHNQLWEEERRLIRATESHLYIAERAFNDAFARVTAGDARISAALNDPREVNNFRRQRTWAVTAQHGYHDEQRLEKTFRTEIRELYNAVRRDREKPAVGPPRPASRGFFYPPLWPDLAQLDRPKKRKADRDPEIEIEPLSQDEERRRAERRRKRARYNAAFLADEAVDDDAESEDDEDDENAFLGN